MRKNYNPRLISDKGIFKFIDNEKEILKSRKVERIFERYRSFFLDLDRLELSPDLTYIQLLDLIEKINSKINVEITLDTEVQSFISQNAYAIEEQKVAGITIKAYDTRWKTELNRFKKILNEEISRPLKEQQLQASFYLMMMKRAANFSVPGAGKTAMMYGTYAYLSSEEISEVERVLVISPLNAFESWENEFYEVFGTKRNLNLLNLRNSVDASEVRTQWGISEVAVLNYESLVGWKLNVLNELIDDKTMIVFDEVHRIKNPLGKRANNALKLGKSTRYKYVLTGTPIPNSYQDIYNFLNFLYDNEYDTYFGWSIVDLENPDPEEINLRMKPFFWRTNKDDLKVPPAEDDYILESIPSREQVKIASTIHEIETNVLARYIRLLQASTNPRLLTQNIDLNSLGFLFDEIDFSLESALDSAEISKSKQNIYFDLGVMDIRTPKFESGMNLIRRLTSKNKKVIVWGMFVGTMQKIHEELNQLGIKAHLIYGATPKDIRPEMINEFRYGDIQVLISNPATLGESISLHQTVHDAIYFEYNFNLTFMLQSRDRIHRLGLPDNQYTRYYYLMTTGDSAHKSFIDRQVYERLKEKEEVMKNAIDGELLIPEVSDDYLEDVKKIILGSVN